MMNKQYQKIELLFEKLTSTATVILGNSITFIIALCIVIFWLTNKMFYKQSIDDSIRDLIHGVTFLSLFIIQKSFNRFSAILHLKVNELVSSNETANNAVMNLEIKTEHELDEMSKEYEDLVKADEQK
jgi:low affinity Fe/Cu permease